MREEDIPDLNLFMMCEQLNEQALTDLPTGYSIRNCRPNELPIWKAFPFDSAALAREYDGFMTNYFAETYGREPALFFRKTLFVCDEAEKPVATCSSWKAYEKFNTLQWFKTLKAYEGKGIGRALLSFVMRSFRPDDYPVFLHTQPGSFRAIKLYSDFGFRLLAGEKFGTRKNDLTACLPILQAFMPKQDFIKLRMAEPPVSFLEAVGHERSVQF